MRRTCVQLAPVLTGAMVLLGWGADVASAAGYRSPLAVVVSADGKRLYVSDRTARSVIFLDSAGEKVLGEVPIPGEPHGLALSADGGRVYVAERNAHAVAVIDTGQGTVAGRIDVGLWPVAVVRSVCISPDGKWAYVESLQPEPNPNLPQLSEAAGRGKVLLEGKADCAKCHPAPYFTDQKMHNLAILSPLEPDGRYDTPSLIESYRTAPYYHDGRAATLKDALLNHNPKALHGSMKDLTPEEVDDLVAYVFTL